MKTTTIATIVVLILIAVGAFFVLRRGDDEARIVTPNESITPQETGQGQFLQTAPSASPEVSPSAADTVAQQNPTVSMTDTGIVPATITVKAGTTITFVNNGTQPHWPASDPHPIHTDLSGFDAKHALAPGDFYRFTFVKVGTFGMHDHLHPSFKATIVVQ